MVSPYKQHMNTQFSTNNFINILYLYIYIFIFKPLHFIFVNCFDVLCNMSFKEHLPKHVGGNAFYNTLNLRSCICTCWFCFSSCVRNWNKYFDCIQWGLWNVSWKENKFGKMFERITRGLLVISITGLSSTNTGNGTDFMLLCHMLSYCRTVKCLNIVYVFLYRVYSVHLFYHVWREDGSGHLYCTNIAPYSNSNIM